MGVRVVGDADGEVRAPRGHPDPGEDLEGPVDLVGPDDSPDGPAVQALVDWYRAAAGEHPDWDEYRAVMVRDRRVLMTMRVQRVYGERIG